MATIPSNLAQAQAMYDTIDKQKQRLYRNSYVAGKQAVMGVNNYLKQNGYNGGAAESILLRTKGAMPDVSSYDAQLADLAAFIQSVRNKGRRAVGGIVPKDTTNQGNRYKVDMSMTTSMQEAKKRALNAMPGYTKYR